MTDKLVKLITSIRFIIIVAIVIVAATFVAWQYHNTTNASRVFWGMVDNNLQTMAYSRHTVQSSGSQSVDQVLQTTTEPVQAVFSETVFNQTGADSATALTENLGTPSHDYVRYTDIKTSQKNSAGQPLDFSKVLNIWGDTPPETPGLTTGQLYNQAVLGIIPTGNVSAAERREIIKIMKEQGAYSYEVSETTRSWPFGRPTYTFQVTVNPEAYITALQLFAKNVGLNHLEGIDPADYKDAQKLSFIVSIDGWTHQMTKTSQGEGAKTEEISGRNLRKVLPEAPSETIPVDQLQTRLQAIE